MLGFSSAFLGLGGVGAILGRPVPCFRRAESRLRPWGTVWNPASGADGKTVGPGAARFAPRRGALCERKWGGSEGGGSRGRPAAPRSGSRASGFPQLPPVFLRSLMEPERGRTGALLQKGRKRRRARGKHVGAAEARRARSEPEERRPGAKVSGGAEGAARGGSELPAPRPSAPPSGLWEAALPAVKWE